MSEVTAEGSRLITLWLGALEAVGRAKSNLNRAECDEINAQEALAKWLMPEDMKAGEKIAVWFGDSLIQIELAPREWHKESGGVEIRHEPKVTIRKRGQKFSELRYAS